MPSLQRSLTGISGILVTPFDEDDRIAPSHLGPIVGRAIDAGVHVLTVNGNTGEYYGLTADEAERMAESVCEMVSGRVPVIGGVGRSVNEAARLAAISAKAGVSALMVHQPPDPFVSPRGLKDYISRISDAAPGVPIVLYLRNDSIGTKAIEALCRVPAVIGVKWATPNPLKLAAAKAAAPDHVVWVGGLAEVWAPPFYAVGARGFTSGLINVWPEHSVAIHEALEQGNNGKAARLIEEMRVFEDIRSEEMGGTNVTGVKSALAMQGLYCGPTRPPSAWPLTTDQEHRLRSFMIRNKLVEEAAQ
ncbi:dihydrodipicolinate synthase family protein [Silicimonas sp. MF1-12-2]|uniref:dihydrodipicolinate synthase family protein n=1 Tax=Silicimonas sp. MF1-12-2 TaxID=3384793 RepID=UPI0039B441BB